MSKNLSAKYYQENKKRLQKKKLVEDAKIFLKKKKKKRNNIIVNVKKISQKRKNKSLLSVGINIIQGKRMSIIIIRKYFNLKSFASL